MQGSLTEMRVFLVGFSVKLAYGYWLSAIVLDYKPNKSG